MQLIVVIDINDLYELPLFVGDIHEVAAWANTTRPAINSAIFNAKAAGRKCKYIRVEVD